MMAPKLKHPLELADSALGRGSDLAMTDTNRDASGGARRLAMRDLKFAGTVAAGLVAGVLGVGALSAPLLGWSNWPDSEKSGDGETPAVKMAQGKLPTLDRPPAERSVGAGTAADSVMTIIGPGGTPMVIAGGGTTGTTGTTVAPGTSVAVSVPGSPGTRSEPEGPGEPSLVVGTGRRGSSSS